MDVIKLRNDTPCENIYMNHGSTSVPPIKVIDAVKRYYDISLKYGGTSAVAERMVLDEYELLKKRILDLINAGSPDEICFMPNGSLGISLVSGGLKISKNTNVVVDMVGFISVAAPLLRLKDLYGIEVRFVSTDGNGYLDLNQLEEKVDENTALVAVTHSPNCLGILQPLKQISEIAHRKGALFLVDVANTIGIADIDVKFIDCDFLVASGRKYLRGPVGSGFIYGKKESVSRITPALAVWNNGVWDWHENDWNWNLNTFSYNKDITRFAYGERDYSAVMGLSSALEYLTEIGGVHEVRKRSNMLLQRMIDGFSSIGNIVFYGPQTSDCRAGVLGFNMDGVQFKSITKYLNENNVGVMGHSFFCPGVCKLYGISGATRISLHCWNTEDEVDYVLNLLDKYKKRMTADL